MESNLQAMLLYWKEFNLQALQQELDARATELAARQDDGDRARKHLVEHSREFKKNASEEVRKNISPLMKSFQVEIDNLSKRSKNAEGAFMSVYKRLIDAPDPRAVLEYALQLQKKAEKVKDLEIVNVQLREILVEYNHEFAELKNQEATIKVLRQQLEEHEDRLEATAQARAKDKEKELVHEFTKKERHIHDMQLAVTKKLGEAERKVAALQCELDATQSELFDLKAKFDEATSAKSDEMEMIVSDLERVNERATSAERQVELLKQQLASTVENQQDRPDDMEQATDILERSNLEVQIAGKEREIAQLVDDVQRLQAAVNKLREGSDTVLAKLEDEIITKTRSIQVMEEKLCNQANYDEIKRELSLLKSIEFGSSGVTEDRGIPDRKPKALETLLLEKNRSLQCEITQLKVSSNDVSDQYGKLQKQYGEAVRSSQEQKQLIAELEEHLRSVNALSSAFRGDAEGATSQARSADFVADAIKDIAQASASEMEPAKTAADALLPIVQSQRERLRLHNQELETEATAMQQQIRLLHYETDKLRTDNVKLYEKIKFVQSYPQRGVASDTERRYLIQYEEKLDPFSRFSRRERQRKYMNLDPYDQVTLRLGRFVLGSKTARTVAFFYTMLLHILVFLVLYTMAYTSSCKRDLAAECHQKFAEHMAKVHGDADWHNHMW